MEGGLARTSKVPAARPESEPLVITLVKYVPADVLATVNEPDRFPLDSEQD
jgi:hypothetical protein